MVNHPVEHSWMIPRPGGRPWTPLPQPMNGLEEASTPRNARIAAQPGAISTKAMLASLLSMGAVGAGALFLMHSLMCGDQSGSQQLGVAELQATGAPIATLAPASLTP